MSFVLKYWDLVSTFYLVQQQKTLSLSWFCCCEWVDAVNLLMLQEIHWVTYSAFVVLRLMFFTFFPLGFLLNHIQKYFFIILHGKPWFIVLSIAVRNRVICYYHTRIRVNICDKPYQRLTICILSKWLISRWLEK